METSNVTGEFKYDWLNVHPTTHITALKSQKGKEIVCEIRNALQILV
jgi:hypothetical protein